MVAQSTSRIKGDVGEKNKHDSAELHVSGEAIYTDDIPEPRGCLHGYILKSPHAHAIIKNIDISACHIPGVHLVLTANDIPGSNDIAPVFGGDPLFAETHIEFSGQSLLAVAAETLEIAYEAAHKAIIEYEILPPVLTTKQSMEKASFVGDPYTMERGDSTKALCQSQNILSRQMHIGGQDHFYLEGQIALAIPEENGSILCWSSTQHPSEMQHLIAKVLGQAENTVTVNVRRMGGGFGGKESQSSWAACIASLMAHKSKRAVKIRFDRDDDMIMTGKRHAFDVDYTVGFNDDGLIQAIEIEHAVRCGMSADLSNAIADRAMFHSDNAYYLNNAKITSYRCKTNTVSDTAFRGFGGPQGMVIIENILDDIAFKLGKDPFEVRMINLYDAQNALSDRSTTHYGMDVEDNILHDLLPELAKNCNYHKRLKEIKTFNDKSPLLKRGIALSPVKFGISFTLTMLNQAGALIHIYKDGSIHLNHGGTEMGQGLHTKISQVVAHEFQVDLTHVRIMATATDKIPNTSATAASSGTDLNGKAAQAAAQTLKKRLVTFASQYYQTPIDDIHFHNNQIHIGTQKFSFKHFISLAYENRISLSSTGFYKTPKIHWNKEDAKGRPFLYFAYGASATEVIIDTLTGEYNILRSDILHDVGSSLNPAIDIGQIEGGYIQGTGWLTSEELCWDEKGNLKTHAPSTYKIPTARDIPDIFNVELYQNSNREDTIHKSKAVGEPPLMHGISSFLAIRHAIASVKSYQIPPKLNTPATPEEVLRTLTALKETTDAS